MRVEFLETISKIAAHTLKDRKQVSEVLRWLKNNRECFNQLITSFDQLIGQFNTESIENIPEECSHARQLKQLLGNAVLPTIDEMRVLENIGSPFNLLRTMKHVNSMMIRGETTKVEPYLAFHTRSADTEALVMGAIIHIVEEYYLANAGLPIDVTRGVIELAIDEMLSLHKDNPFWDAIANKERLNWIDGYAGFSEEFRHAQGLS